MRRSTLVLVLIALAAASLVPAAPDKPPVLPRPELAPADPPYIDDEELFNDVIEKLSGLAAAGKCLSADKIAEKLKPGACRITTAAAGDAVLSPEDVYERSRAGVLVLASVVKNKESGEWEEGGYSTAWAATADGVLVTNWHVFDKLDPDTAFGAADHVGNVYPLTDILHADKVQDIAVVKVDAKGLSPLPVAAAPARVGSWVGVVGHPDYMFYTFTQGHVSRYSKNKTDDGQTERWMSVTADYATGSSGSPVLNRYGAVVGMAALTVNIDAPPDAPPPAADAMPPKPMPKDAPPPREKDAPKPEPKGPPGEPPPPPGSSVQMVVKLTVPVPQIRKALGADPPKP